MKIIVTLFLIMNFSRAWGQSSGNSSSSSSSASSKTRGISFDGALGYSQFELTNPNDTPAYYTGVAIQGRGSMPIIESRWFTWRLYGQIRYFDLSNSANGTSQKEMANHIGPGLGTGFEFSKLVFGVDYSYMAARHYAVGTFSNDIKFSYRMMSVYAGLKVDFGQLQIMGTYSMGSSSVAESETNLTKATPVKYSAVWLHAVYSTGASFGTFLVKLFK